jgi:hypothetical protein
VRSPWSHASPDRHDEFRWFVTQDPAGEPPAGMETLRQIRLPLHHRDSARPLLVPPLERGGAQRTQYVPLDDVVAVRTAIGQRPQLGPPAWSLRQTLADSAD